MTGAEALAYLQRRLGESGLAVEADRTAELFDYITEGRDQVRSDLALSAPIAVQEDVTLEPDVNGTPTWSFPADKPNPIRILRVYDDGTGRDLTPAAELNKTNGHYRWDGLTQLTIADSYTPIGNIAVLAVMAADTVIDNSTASANFGAWELPIPAHRAAVKYAAILALTDDESSDAASAQRLYDADLAKLVQVYGDFDAQAGLAMRDALMESAGEFFGDTLY